jgi:hypothetical protein
MSRDMDLEGNHKMNWFFNEYVYGTQLPTYKLESSVDSDANGDVVLNLKATQSGVDEHFRMLVPFYLEMPDGKVLFVGRLRLVGNMTLEPKIALTGLKTKPKRVLINYYDDVLCTPN